MSTPQELQDILLKRKLSICCAESVTGGGLGAAIASVSGASKYFAGTLCAYNLDIKYGFLGVNDSHAQQVDCVSPRVAEEMARGAEKMFNTDVAVSITGYAEAPADLDICICHWCVVLHTTVIESGTYTMGKGNDRTHVQKVFAAHVLQQTVEALSRD